MPYRDSEYSDSEDFFLDKDEIDIKVRECFNIIDRDETYLNREFLEDTIEICIDHFRFKDGLKITNAVLKISAFDSDQWFNKGYCLAQLKRYNHALIAYNRARSLNPSDVELLLETASVEVLLNKFDDAEKTLGEALQLSDNHTQIYYDFGLLYKNKGNFKSAIEYFNKMLRLEPNSLDALFQIGVCYESLRNYKKALSLYESYLNIDPECPFGWYNKAVVLEKLKMYEIALDSYQFSIALNSDFYDAWFNYANLLADLDRFHDAIEAFQQVIRIEPKDESAFFNIAAIYEELGQLQNAIHFYSKVIEIDSGYQDAYINRGYCYLKLGFRSLALEDLKGALENNYTSDVQWDIRLDGERIIDENDLNTERKLKTKLNSEPDDVQSLIQLAEVQLKLARVKDALHTINDVINIKSARSHAHYLLAQLYFILSLNEKAIHFLGCAINDNSKIKKRFAKDFPLVAESRLLSELVGSI